MAAALTGLKECHADSIVSQASSTNRAPAKQSAMTLSTLLVDQVKRACRADVV